MMSIDDSALNILYWCSAHGNKGHHCGYCKSHNSITDAVQAECLTPECYQRLIDRGWWRSGKHCYKPNMALTCCAQYPISCTVDAFRFSKSQKKVVKRMNKFLHDGQRQQHDTLDNNDGAGDSTKPETKRKEVRQGVGADETRAPCKKAKAMRAERRAAKATPTTSHHMEKKSNMAKTLAELLAEVSADDKHRLEIKTVSVANWEAVEHADDEFELYKKYQVRVHGDAPDEVSPLGFEKLVETPLLSQNPAYGTFHQQYWLNGDQLLAVGVIDILPKCVSSEYFFYDPDFAFLTLGTYGLLREVDYTLNLRRAHPTIEYYRMGFYVHSCLKMRYIAQLHPSYLLCPETYTWQPVAESTRKLNTTKYSRLADEPSATDNERVSDTDMERMKVGLYTDDIELTSLGVVLRRAQHQGERETWRRFSDLLGRSVVLDAIVIPCINHSFSN